LVSTEGRRIQVGGQSGGDEFASYGTQVGHFGDHSRNQRRFAPTLPHFKRNQCPTSAESATSKHLTGFCGVSCRCKILNLLRFGFLALPDRKSTRLNSSH